MKNILITTIFLLISSFINSQDTTNTWISEWQKSTVSIGKIDTFKQGRTSIPYYNVFGTGVFFYIKKYDTIVIPCLVTAKHIFQDSLKNWFPESISVRYSWFDEQPIDKYFGFEIKLIENKNKLWFEHPDMQSDLACVPVFNIPYYAIKDNDSKVPLLPYNQIAFDVDIFEGESILIFGYPGAVGPDFNTKAIVRQGIIAWTPPKYTSNSRILIDCEVFPGNSGGPVFTYPIGINRQGEFELGKKVKFIGIVVERRKSETELYSTLHPNVPIRDNLGNLIISYESIGIGVVEPSIKIRELLKFTQDEINR